jgi:uncharacterized membrane protein YvbJ
MALINCPECGATISDQAISCPRCAFPLQNNVSQESDEDDNVQTIQQTSKKLKSQELVWIVLTFLGFILLLLGVFNGDSGLLQVGFISTIVGAILYFIIRAKIWWHHE